MQDFACNGYACDELNRCQLGLLLPEGLKTNIYNAANNHQQNTASAVVETLPPADITAAASLSQQRLQQLPQHNLNNSFWKMLPSHLQQQHSRTVNAAAVAAAAAAAAAAVNIDYNSNQKKLPKRYNTVKNEKYVSILS